MTDGAAGGGLPHRDRQAWLAVSSLWAQHVTDCDACYVGETCLDEPGLFARVVAAFATVRQGRHEVAGSS